MSAPAEIDKKALEEGDGFAPQFSPDGLIVCVAVDAATGDILMLAHMNREALDKTLATGTNKVLVFDPRIQPRPCDLLLGPVNDTIDQFVEVRD